MALLDHFHPPLSKSRHWQAIHGAWANSIAFQLNALLPQRYFAEATIAWGRGLEIDVATLDSALNREELEAATGGTVATAIWSPPKPATSIAVDFADLDLAEIRVFNDEEGPRLVAAIELVSPANKDRPATRDAFARKCAAYIQEGIGLVIVDVVTNRLSNLHERILDTLNIASSGNGKKSSLGNLYAVAYRIERANQRRLFQIWPEELELGVVLPTMPLWISDELVLPLDLEASYSAVRRGLKIDE